MRVKYLAQEHNAVPRPGLEPGPFDPESSALTIRPPRLPLDCHTWQISFVASNDGSTQVQGHKLFPLRNKIPVLHFAGL